MRTSLPKSPYKWTDFYNVLVTVRRLNYIFEALYNFKDDTLWLSYTRKGATSKLYLPSSPNLKGASTYPQERGGPHRYKVFPCYLSSCGPLLSYWSKISHASNSSIAYGAKALPGSSCHTELSAVYDTNNGSLHWSLATSSGRRS